MLEPWEIFWNTWILHAPAKRPYGEAALEIAGRETIRSLRNDREWTWLNSRILAGRLVETAAEWALAGEGEPAVLRARLREVWTEEGEMEVAERSWRAATERILADTLPEACAA